MCGERCRCIAFCWEVEMRAMAPVARALSSFFVMRENIAYRCELRDVASKSSALTVALHLTPVSELSTGEVVKRRRVITDVSASYASSLASSAPAVLNSVEDLRRELSASLPGTIFVQNSHVTLLTKATVVLPLEASADQAMEEIEDLFVHPWLYRVKDGTEEVWANTADMLTGSVLATLDDLTRALRMDVNRNAKDPSGTTDAGLRPDYWLLVDGALLLKAEHKRTPDELEVAKEELASKMKSWNPVALRGLPFIPCYAVGGEKLQFCAIVPNSDGTCGVYDASDVFDMYLALDRLHIVRTSFNLFRVLISLRRMMPATVPSLYKMQPRPNGASITVMDDDVRKVCYPAENGVYECLMGDARIPFAICIAKKVQKGARVALTIKPVCAQVMPKAESELRRAIRCVLTALASFHARGFVHRDVRWPNVLRDFEGNWLLSDFELASKNGVPLPGLYLGSLSFPPEAQRGEPFTSAGDVWQVGLLVKTWSAQSSIRVLPPLATAFVQRLMSDDQMVRPTCAQALLDPWLRMVGSD